MCKRSKLTFAAFGLAILGVAACAAPAEPPIEPDRPAAVVTAANGTTEAECTARGGKLQRAGRGGNLHCITPYADAGKVCTDKGDCLGRCIAAPESGSQAGTPAKGLCQADDNVFGCTTWIEGGKIAGAICVD
jgi:hypothetical protein